MKLVSYLKEDNISVGIVEEDTIIDVSDKFPDMLSIIHVGADAKVELESALVNSTNKIPLNSCELMSPMPEIKRNILCVGWNYLEHFNERARTDIQLPEKPTIFTKATTSVAGPYEEIPAHAEFTKMLDYEAELAVVIGKEGNNISESDAAEHIFGYMAANDVSARDVQQAHGGQWYMGKSMDKSCPMGPWLVTKDEVEDIQDLDIKCKVNGEVVQSSNTSLMIFSINKIISELSKAMTLMPGDVILTGTPSGVGFKRNPPILLKAGDEVEVIISEIGSIKNKIM